jgi:hypothetical protein
MEKLYRKLSNGRYVEAGYDTDLMSDGVWLVQTKPSSRSVTSLVWRVGEIKRPADIVTHASLQTLESELGKYIHQLTKEDSAEYQELKKMYGDWVGGPLTIVNVTCSELASLVLRRIAIQLEDV